jgi:tetratricopeptide (TPR) repeat protein
MAVIALPLLLWLLAPAPDAAGWRAHVEALAGAEDAESALRLAQGFGQRGDRAAALRWAAEAELRGAQPLRVAVVRGDIAFAAEDWVAALSNYLEVSQSAPAMAYAQVRLWHSLRRAPADALADTVDVARVRTFLTRAGYHVPLTFPATPDRAGALAATARGHAALTRGETPEAISAFYRAIALDPTCPEAWRGLATAETRAGHAAAARAASHLFLSLDPPDTLDTRRVRTILVDDARRRGLEKARP